MMLTLPENSFYQSGKAGSGADFNKGTDAGCIHRFDFGDKLDRSGKLAGKEFLCAACSAG